MVRVGAADDVRRWLAAQTTMSESINILIREEIAADGWRDRTKNVKQTRARRKKKPANS
jgi:hypothetical protein